MKTRRSFGTISFPRCSHRCKVRLGKRSTTHYTVNVWRWSCRSAPTSPLGVRVRLDWHTYLYESPTRYTSTFAFCSCTRRWTQRTGQRCAYVKHWTWTRRQRILRNSLTLVHPRWSRLRFCRLYCFTCPCVAVRISLPHVYWWIIIVVVVVVVVMVVSPLYNALRVCCSGHSCPFSDSPILASPKYVIYKSPSRLSCRTTPDWMSLILGRNQSTTYCPLLRWKGLPIKPCSSHRHRWWRH